MSKKEIILLKALELFASKGYDATSTRQIATEAQVSEGLIFRHFNNKEGLLEAVLQQGINRATQYITPILEMTDPRQIIESSICLPIHVPVEEHEFWKLLYNLKWQRANYPQEAFALLQQKLTSAFESLGFEYPELEARLIEIYIDGLATEILLRGGEPTALTQKILTKYFKNEH